MKKFLSILLVLVALLCIAAVPTATFKAVTSDPNGILTWPANFLTANIIAGSGVSITPVDTKIVITATGSGGGDVTLPDSSAALAAILGDENGNGRVVYDTSPTITSAVIVTPSVSGAISLPSGVRQTFKPNTTTSGLNIGSVAGDPSGAIAADVWYNTTSTKFRARIGSQNVDVANGYQYDFATPTTITSASSIAVDLSAAQYQTCTLATDTTLTTANRPSTGGRSVTVFFTASGGARLITLSGSWKNYSSASSFTIQSGKEAFVTFLCLGPNETDVRIVYGSAL